MSRPVRLATLLIAAVLAGTVLAVATHYVTTRRPLTTGTVAVRPLAAAAAAPARSSTDVCTGVRGCTVVATVDVDGDGRGDQVGVSSRQPADGGTITVRVRTATKQTLQTTGRNVYWFGKPFLGAVPVDGRAGAEIVVGATMGANYEQFRVVTYRQGKLVTLKAPPTVWTKAGMAKSTSRWAIDGSYSFNTGVYRHVSDAHVVSVTMKTAVRNESGRGFTGHTNVYRWQAGHWQKVSAKKVTYATDRSVFGLGGWHVKGLHAFAE